MAPSFEDIIQSPQFTFLVGTGKTPIVVHAAAIAATSGPMHALINGPMSESQTKSATIEDVEVEDFIRFCEYAYHGNFTAPALVEELSSGLPLTTEDELDLIPSDNYNQLDLENCFIPCAPRRKKGAVHSVRKSGLRDVLKGRAYLVDGHPSSEILKRFIVLKANTTGKASQEFAPIFLAYARLYTFANMQLVEPLKALTLDKLRQVLLLFQVHIESVTDIIKLARYAYNSDHTADRERDGTIDELRKLVVEFVACEIDIIGTCVEFAELLEEGGEFVRDFWGIAMEHLI